MVGVVVDVGVGVRVEHLPDAELVEQDAAEFGVALAQGRPLLGGELGGFEQRAGLQVGVHRGQRDQVRRVHGGEQGGDLSALVERLVEGIGAAVQGGAGGGAGQREGAAAELVAQLLGVRGQVAEGAQLDGGVAGRGGLVEEPVPGHLLRVVGEPDAPRVRGGAEPQVGQGGRAHGDFSLSQEAGAAWMAPAAGRPPGCSESGVGCVECTESRFRYIRRWRLSGCCSRRSRRSCRCWSRRRTTGR